MKVALPFFGTLVLLVATTTVIQATETPSTKSEKWHWPWDKKHHKETKDAEDTEEAKADEIHFLPGWQDKLPSRMFAGLIDAGTKTEGNATFHLHEHYFFVESEGDPAKDPLIIWTNGGPGASSMFGLFLELGPFYLSGASHYTEYAYKTGIPSLFRNDYSWSKLANLLIINSPPPVGYSYCDPVGPTGDGNSCGSWNDELTARHNALYLESFFKRYKKYSSSDYYIMGESYAGVYVPTLVRHILDHSQEMYLEDDENDIGIFSNNEDVEKKKKTAWSLKQNLKGFAVGDGCMGVNNVCGKNGPGPIMGLEFMRGHGQFSDKLYHETFHMCSKEDLIGFRTDGDNFGPSRGVTNSTCRDHLKKIEAAVGPYYAYNIYDACWYQNDLEPPHNTLTETRNYFSRVPPHSPSSGRTQQQRSTTSKNVRERDISLEGAINDYPCGGDQAFFDWVMTPQVKKALHVAPGATFFSGDNGVGFTYKPTEPDLMPFYQRAVKETDLRVLVYNGDTALLLRIGPATWVFQRGKHGAHGQWTESNTLEAT